jgi:hypothetical protein
MPQNGTTTGAAISSGGDQRDEISNVVRAARDQMRRLTGQPPPALRVVVHPTVDAFVRATGQPWWVSGATEGGTIELAPITLLRQRGQFERTIRHEVAHVFIDRVLEKRDEWVREGAASYFAEPNATVEPGARVQCPSDEELLRPVSAGMHRGALARAEACFRGEIAKGKRWDEVR